jgi:hypothetical protein
VLEKEEKYRDVCQSSLKANPRLILKHGYTAEKSTGHHGVGQSAR